MRQYALQTRVCGLRLNDYTQARSALTMQPSITGFHPADTTLDNRCSHLCMARNGGRSNRMADPSRSEPWHTGMARFSSTKKPGGGPG